MRNLALFTLLLWGCPSEPKIEDPPGTDPPTTDHAPPPRNTETVARAVFAMDAVEAPAAPTTPPLSLTASDGTGLRLIALSAQAVLEEPLAFTELHLTFENPNDRVLEGRFAITLPENASISRFAMKIGDRWQEGEVLEKQAARRAYEDFLHRRQDPALLEQSAGNEFTARVFPIPARAQKELIISYSHELTRPDEPFRIPLLGLPQLGNLEIRALLAKTSGGATTSLGGTTVSHEVVEVKKSGWVPDRDFEVPQRKVEGRLGLRHANLVVARIAPQLSAESEPLRSVLFLVDSSASRGLGYTRQIDKLSQLLSALSDKKLPITVAAFDQEAQVLWSGPAGEFSGEARKKLLERRALGASNFEQALKFAAEQAKKSPYQRLIWVTDGVPTTGAIDGDILGDLATSLSGLGVERIDAILMGGLRDTALMSRIVGKGGRPGALIDGDRPLAEVGQRLSQATLGKTEITVEGAKWVWPTSVEGLQPGDNVLVYADLPEGQPFRLRMGGLLLDATDRTLSATERPLLERAWVKARISRLSWQRDTQAANDPDLREALKQQITKLSVEHRVLSQYTALLVLETEADYARFGIERRALADILTVGATGLTVLARKNAPVAPPAVTGAPKPTMPRREQEAERNRQAPRDEEAVEGAPGADSVPVSAPAKEEEEMADGKSKKDDSADMPAERSAPAPAAEAKSVASESGEADDSLARRPNSLRPPPQSRPPPSPPPPPEPPRDQGPVQGAPPYEGQFAEIMSLIGKKNNKALEKAWAWQQEAPGDILALVGLGEAAEAAQDITLAARAYGSMIDLFPGRADLRRFAGGRLERLKSQNAQALAADSYAKAAADRPDHPASHRMLAMARAKLGDFSGAFEALVFGLQQNYPDRFRGVSQILQEDLGLVAAAWSRAEPQRAEEISQRLSQAGGIVENKPSVRFVLSWETDANDVDFHIYDGRGGHAYYSAMQLPSGGELYADITTGYGPECFTIRSPKKARPYPYKLQAHYYSRGPMGYGMGKLQIVEHDGNGNLSFEERPFVVMVDGAFVDLGKVTR